MRATGVAAAWQAAGGGGSRVARAPPPRPPGWAELGGGRRRSPCAAGAGATLRLFGQELQIEGEPNPSSFNQGARPAHGSFSLVLYPYGELLCFRKVQARRGILAGRGTLGGLSRAGVGMGWAGGQAGRGGRRQWAEEGGGGAGAARLGGRVIVEATQI